MAFALSVAALFFVTTAAAREASATRTLTVTPTAHGFGPVPIGTSDAFLFTLSSDGASDGTDNGIVTISTITKAAGAGCADVTFTPAVPPVVALDPTETLDVTVSFAPQVRGAISCTITIGDNDGLADTIVVTGTGTGPQLSVSPPGPLTFVNRRINTGPSATQSIRVSNSGEGTLAVSPSTISLGGTGASQFVLDDSAAVDLAAGEFFDITVAFSPTTAGLKQAAVTVTSDDPVDPDEVVNVSGTGTSSVISVPASFGHGNVVVGSTSNGSISVQNTGTVGVPFTVTEMTITGTDANQFTFESQGCTNTQTCGTDYNVLNGTPVTVVVRCHPTSVGLKQATLTFDSDADSGGETVDLSCTGVKPDISVTPPDIAFGNQPVGVVSTAHAFAVENTGTSQLQFHVIKAPGSANPNDFSIGSCTTTCNVAPGDTTTVNITFTPGAVGARSATLRFVSNDQETPNDDHDVGGTGTQPDIALTVPSSPAIAFGDVQISQNSGNQTITITNEGNGTLGITAVALNGGQTNQFTIVSGTTTAHNVAPGATSSWQVRCNPTSIGDKATSFRISSNDPDEATLAVALSCRGVDARLSASPSPIDIQPPTRVGETSDDVTVTLTNVGNLPLTINAITRGDSQFHLVELPTLPVTLDGGDTAQFKVNFEPAGSGDPSDVITVDTDVADTLINITGHGRTAELTVTPMPFSFGIVDVCDPDPTQAFTLTNTGEAPWLYVSATVTAGGDFEIVPPLPPAQTVAVGGHVTVTVKLAATTAGDKSGSLTVNTDIPNAAVTDVGLTATAIRPDVSLSATALPFDGWDVQATTPSVRTLTVTNNGTAPLEIEAATITGADAAVFQLADTVELPVELDPGGSYNIDVNFRPTIEQMYVDANLELQTNAPSSLECGGELQIPLTGRGLDRHIATLPDDRLVFPETFRNPAEPTVEPLIIQNTAGTAPLRVDMLVDGEVGNDWFLLPDVFPLTIEPGGEQTIDIGFKPTAGNGSVFEAWLDIYNDDSDRMIKRITLAGTPVVPNVTFAPNEIDLGRTGVQIPVRATAVVPTGLEVRNLDATHSFTVREVTFTDDAGNALVGEPLTVIGLAPSMTLAAMQGTPIDIEFVSDTPQIVEARMWIYVDADPEPITYVTVKAEAVDVDLRGGGCGCDASEAGGGRGARGGAATVGLVLLAIALATRRRRRGAALLALAVGAVGAAASPAAAEPTRDIELSTFAPEPGVETPMFAVEGALVGPPGSWGLGVSFNHAVNPLNIVSPQVEGMTDRPITARTGIDLNFAYAFGGRYEAGVRVPLLQQSGDRPMFSGLDPADGMSLGDVELHAKMFLFQAAPLVGALSAGITAPTARDGQFAGVDGPTAHLRAIAGFNVGRLQLLANGGFRLRQTSELGDVDQGNELTYGLGGSVRATSRLWVIGELFGAFGLGAQETTGVSPLEASLGVRLRLLAGLSVAVGGGRGILPGVGAPDARGFVLVSFAPGSREPSPLVSGGGGGGDIERPADRGDDDGDGIANADDRCADEAEDKDGFQDDDGCPEADNDGDGLLDAADPCPTVAEDKDGFKDDDGCPDPDNDGDGVPDEVDRCPNEPEDVDGFEDRDGCDDPDNDADGIPDVVDQCALEQETINGNVDEDGCPDTGDSLVLVMPDRIEVFEPVRFAPNSAKLQKKSFNVLGQVAATLRANRDFLRVRISVHVHPRNSRDQELSDKRADAVREWLVQWGIDPDRLEVKGFGSTKPLAAKSQRGAEEVNDRVEFILLEKKVKK